jgi:hypothetical protein
MYGMGFSLLFNSVELVEELVIASEGAEADEEICAGVWPLEYAKATRKFSIPCKSLCFES